MDHVGIDAFVQKRVEEVSLHLFFQLFLGIFANLFIYFPEVFEVLVIGDHPF